MSIATLPSTDSTHQELLPSGRSVKVRVVGEREELEIRSPAGEVEVRIEFTDAGPVVKLHAARLELSAPETVAVKCQRFEVDAAEDVTMRAGHELRVKTEDDIHLNGAVIRLNC